jgi:hypothetical protein
LDGSRVTFRMDARLGSQREERHGLPVSSDPKPHPV